MSKTPEITMARAQTNALAVLKKLTENHSRDDLILWAGRAGISKTESEELAEILFGPAADEFLERKAQEKAKERQLLNLIAIGDGWSNR